MQNPLVKHSIRFAKKMVKMVIGKNKGIVSGMSFLMITDSDEPQVTAFAQGLIPYDGHPMTNPMNNDWCICDTYPDTVGDRDLFLYSFSQDKRVDLGKFRRLFETPDMQLKKDYFMGIDANILQLISEEQLAFTRSGLHCDLHPRWSADGQWAVFDSIHEGTRQIYRVNVSDFIK